MYSQVKELEEIHVSPVGSLLIWSWTMISQSLKRWSRLHIGKLE